MSARTQLADEYGSAPLASVGTIQTITPLGVAPLAVTLPTDAEYTSVDPMAPWWNMSVRIPAAGNDVTVCFGANATGTQVLAANALSDTTRTVRVRRGQAVGLSDPLAGGGTVTVEKFIPTLNWE